MQYNETNGIHIEGHVKIHDPITNTVYFNNRNAIHYENFSVGLASSIANSGQGFIYSLDLGNGGSTVDPTGIITYLTPNTSGSNARLYNQTYSKVVDDKSTANLDPTRNYIETRHVTGTSYTDVFITCFLDYGEPVGQLAFDNVLDNNSPFVFDELGLRSYSTSGTGLLLTHLIFHPVQKSLSKVIQIDYTVRIHSLSGV